MIRGVVTRVWKPAPATLRTVLDLSLGHGDEDFLVYEDERFTFDEHYRVAATLAHRLIDASGCAKGDRVAIAMRNLPEWVMAFWARSPGRRGRRPAQRLVDRRRARVRRWATPARWSFVDEERLERIGPHLGDPWRPVGRWS